MHENKGPFMKILASCAEGQVITFASLCLLPKTTIFFSINISNQYVT